MSNVAVIEPRETRAPLMAGARPQAIVPTDMESAYRLANAVCMAGMAPKGLDTPEKAMVAIMHGLEIGLTPMAALQRIAVVNGRPTIWGDGAIGLVRGSGLCEYVKEYIEGAGDQRAAICEAKRKGEPEPIRRAFRVSDAKTAGLWGKSGPWQQYPERMLQMRARAFTLRDGFADVLGGLYIKEELDDVPTSTPPAPPRPAQPSPAIEHHPEPKQSTSPSPPKPPTPPKAIAAPAPKPAASDEPFIDPERLLRDWEDAAAGARDEATLNEARDEIVKPAESALFPPDREQCDRIYRERLRAIGP